MFRQSLLARLVLLTGLAAAPDGAVPTAPDLILQSHRQ
jgi:hypothetical protein